MAADLKNRAKSHVESALSHYAAVFRSIAEEDPNGAAMHMGQLRQVDDQARESLACDEYLYYEQQRNTLIKRFGERLVHELQDQLQDDMIHSAKKLVEAIEKIRVE